MPKATYVRPNGEHDIYEVQVGTSVMQAAVANGVEEVVAECGGNLMCATCHVYVDPEHLGKLPPVSDDEDELLECVAGERRPNSRLSCQLVMTDDLDGLVVHLPEEQA